MTYNGWPNHATWDAHCFLNGDYEMDGDTNRARVEATIEAARGGHDALREHCYDITHDVLDRYLDPATLTPRGEARPGYDLKADEVWTRSLVGYSLQDVDWYALHKWWTTPENVPTWDEPAAVPA